MPSEAGVKQRDVHVQTSSAVLDGHLVIPDQAQGIVIFAHGSGSSRFSPRNQEVAEKLHAEGLATLLFDLLTTEEHLVDQQTRALRFDTRLLTARLTGAVDWVRQNDWSELPIGLFGASTGAAAALMTAAARPTSIAAVVSRGGRPDLAEAVLAEVRAPTLLIVGGHDTHVLRLNRRAAESLVCEHKIEVVPGASHLFEEPGKLDEVARLAGEWFRAHLSNGTGL